MEHKTIKLTINSILYFRFYNFTHCQLSQKLDYYDECSYCRRGWHHQLLGLGGNYFFT